MEIRFTADERALIDGLGRLSAEEFSAVWTTAVMQFVQDRARRLIGGDFGDLVARHSILADGRDPSRPAVYLGGENGYIAEHIHTGGVIRPKTRKYLAVPVDRSVRGKYPREYGGELQVVADRRRNRAYLGVPMKRKFKPLWILLHQVSQKPRPWWPDDGEAEKATIHFIHENFPDEVT